MLFKLIIYRHHEIPLTTCEMTLDKLRNEIER